MTEVKLRRDWVRTTLGEVCKDPQYGWTTSAAASGRLHLVRTTDITSGHIDWRTVPFCTEEPTDVEKYALKDGDIVISRAGSVGFSHLVRSPRKAVFASYLIRFRPLVDGSYVNYFLKSPSYWRAISEKSMGIALANVNATKLRQIPLPLPPLPEQKRIVAKIEELFSDLDAGVEALRKAKAEIKRYRQAVLKHALEGSLTNDRPAAPRESDWRSTTVGAVIDGRPRNGFSPKPVDFETPVKCLTLTATTSGVFRDGFFKYIDADIPKDSRLWVKHNDILVQRGNTAEYVGVPALYEGPDNRYLYPDLMIKLVAGRSVLPKYLWFALSDEKARNYMRTKATGTAGSMPKINQGILESVPLDIPSLAEQQQIVSEIERRFSVAGEAEKVIDRSLKQAETLRQSILKRAFEGRLVPQDPTDEPAVKLLERIRAEREEKGQGKRGARRIRAGHHE